MNPLERPEPVELPPAAPARGGAGGGRPLRPRWGRVLLRVVLVLVGLLVAGLVALQRPAVATRLVNAILVRTTGVPRATMSVEEARLEWFSGFEVRGYRWARGDTLLARLDTLSVRYRLTTLLTGHLEAQHLHLAGAFVAAEIADTTRTSAEKPPLTLADLLRGRFYPGPALRVDHLTLRDARYGDGAAAPDSGFRLTVAALTARDLRLGDGFSFKLDTLVARLEPAGSPSRSFDFGIAAALSDGRLDLASLRAMGPATLFTARGRLAVDTRDSLAEVSLALAATPLALQDLAVFAPGLPLSGSSTLAVDLHGARPDRLSGTASVGLERARIGPVQLGPLRLDLTQVDGRAEARLVTSYQGATIKVDGWLRSLDRTPTYDLELQSDGLPDSLPGAPWWTPLAMRTEAHVQMRARGTGFWPPVLEVAGRVEQIPGRIDLDARLDLTRGVAWTLRRLGFADLDLAHVLGDTSSSSLNGALTGEGLAGTGAGRASVALRVDPSRYGRWSVTRADAGGALNGSRLGLALRAETNAGLLVVDSLTARWDRDGTFRLTGLRFQGLDLSRLTGQEPLASRLDGRLSVEGRGLNALLNAGPPAPRRPWASRGAPALGSGPLAALRDGRLSARFRLDLSPSGFRDEPITHAWVEGSLAGGAVDLDASLVAADGRLDLEGAARPFDDRPAFTVRRGRFTDVNLAGWTGTAALRSRLSGLFSGGSPSPADSAHREAWLALRLDRSPIANIVLEGGEAQGSWSSGHAHLTASLRAVGDTVSASGEASLGDHSPHGRLDGSLPLTVLAALAGRDSLPTTGRITGRVTWTGDDRAGLTLGAIVSGAGSIDRARLDSLRLAARLARGTLELDTLFVASNVATVVGAGRVALFDSAAAPTDLGIAVTVRDAAPLKALFGADTLAVGVGTLQGHVRGPHQAPAFDLTGSLRALAWNGVRLLRADGSAHGEFDRAWRPTRIEGAASLDRLQAFDVSVDDVTMSAAYRDRQARFQLTSDFDRRHGCRLAALVVMDSAGAHVTLDTLAVRADSAAWTLARPAHCDLSAGRLAVSGFELGSAGGRVTAHGVIDRRGEQSFQLDAHRVGLDLALAWLGREDAHGTLDASLALAGPAAAPSGTGSLRVDLASGAHPAGRLRSDLAWNGTRLEVGGRFKTAAGDSLAWAGHLPLAFSLAADTASRAHHVQVLEGDVDVRVTADRFPLRAFAIFLDPASVGELGGTLDVDARLQGTSRALSGSGHLEVADGVVPLPGLGATYRDIQVLTAFQNDSLVVRRAHVAAGKGTLDATGRIRFVSVSRVEPLLHVTARRFAFAQSNDLKVSTTAELDLSGSLTQPVARGKVSVENTNITFKQSDLAASASGDVQLSDADVRMMEETFGYVKRPSPNMALALYDASDLDLGVTLGGNCWLRQRVQPQLSVALTGQFRLRKAPHGEPELFGRIEPVPQRGYVEQFARNFDITGGEVLLNGKPKDHTVDIQAEYKPPTTSESEDSGVKVHLAVQGTAEQLRLTLSSEPAMSDAEIVNFIATGRSRVNPSTSGTEGSSLAKDIGLAQVTGPAEAAAQEAIGVDVLQVRFDALQGATLVSGSYLNPKLYVGFRQPLQYKDSSSPTATETYRTRYEVEYAIHRWLVVNLQGETSKLRSFIRARHAY